MPGEMGLGDVQQKLEGSILMYNKKPILFQKVDGNLRNCRVYDLMAQKEEIVEFDEKMFHPPIPRIGMVNIGGSVLYVKRTAIRRYKLGLCSENLLISEIGGVAYPERAEALKREIRGLRSKELAQSLLKKYPTLRQAFKKVRQFDGACAFDKQFAVTHHGYLVYKEQIVGKHDFETISFLEGFEHLSMLVNV
jgi:hypothetical protein